MTVKCNNCGWSESEGHPHVMTIDCIRPQLSHTIPVNQIGDHYEKLKIQPIEFISANDLDFFQGNIIKYVCRYKHKDGIKDLEKAKDYIERLIKKESK